MKQRLNCQSRISNTSHELSANQSGTPPRQAPSRASPWLVPSHTTKSEPEKIQLNSEKWWTMDLSVPPTSPNSLPICSRPTASPHLGKYTWASVANSSRIEPPLEVTPPLSKALRYSRATDLRCSSVMVSLVIVMGVSFFVRVWAPAPYPRQGTQQMLPKVYMQKRLGTIDA